MHIKKLSILEIVSKQKIHIIILLPINTFIILFEIQLSLIVVGLLLINLTYACYDN